MNQIKKEIITLISSEGDVDVELNIVDFINWLVLNYSANNQSINDYLLSYARENYYISNNGSGAIYEGYDYNPVIIDDVIWGNSDSELDASLLIKKYKSVINPNKKNVPPFNPGKTDDLPF